MSQTGPEEDEEEARKKQARKRQQEIDDLIAQAQKQDDYGRESPKTVATQATVEAEAPQPVKPPAAAKPPEDDYARTAVPDPITAVGAQPVQKAPDQTAPAQTAPASSADALRDYFQACQDNDAATAVKLAAENSFSPTQLKHGINMLALTHQNYEGTGQLLAAGGLAGKDGVDAGFMSDLLDRTRDREGAVAFLQGMGAKFNDEHMMKVQSTNPLDAIKIIKAGQFDPGENGSQCLLYAAADGQKSVFNAMMEAGANPLTAIQKGSNDPRYAGAYETATAWAGEYYKAHPEITPPKQGAVSLEAVAERKISRLAPTVR